MKHSGRTIRGNAHTPCTGHFVYLLQRRPAALRRHAHRHQRPVAAHIGERRAVPHPVLRAVEQIEIAREAEHENVLVRVYRAAGRLAPRPVLAARELPQIAVAGRAQHLLTGHEARPKPTHHRVAVVGRSARRAKAPLVVVRTLRRQLARGLAAQLACALARAFARLLASSLAPDLTALAGRPLAVLAHALTRTLAALTRRALAVLARQLAVGLTALAALADRLAAALARALALLAEHLAHVRTAPARNVTDAHVARGVEVYVRAVAGYIYVVSASGKRPAERKARRAPRARCAERGVRADRRGRRIAQLARADLRAHRAS